MTRDQFENSREVLRELSTIFRLFVSSNENREHENIEKSKIYYEICCIDHLFCEHMKCDNRHHEISFRQSQNVTGCEVRRGLRIELQISDAPE